jgi:hypothetical protein
MSEQESGENLIKVWAETQQKLLTNWLDTVRGFGGTPSLELWTKTVEAWQTSVKETLDARARWMQAWTETLATAQGTPEELRALAKQGREALQRWTEVERQLWQSWFNIVKDINFRIEPGTGAQAGRDLVQTWQEAAHKMIDTQADWVRRWTDAGSRSRKQ